MAFVPHRPAPGARLTLLLTSTLTVLAAISSAPALPGLRDAFAATPQVEVLAPLVLVVPALFIVLGAPLAGLLADRIGRKPLLVGSVLLYVAAGSSGAWLPSLPLILAGRALLGLSMGGIMTAATTLLADRSEGLARQRLLGLQAAFIGLGGAAYLLLGGFLAEASWRVPFLLHGVGLLLVPPILLRVRESRQAGPDAPSGSLPLRPLLPLWLLTLLAQAIFYLAPTQLPFHLQTLGAPAARLSGLALALLMASYALGALASARVLARIGRGWLFSLAFTGVGVGFVSVGLAPVWLALLPGLGAAGVGLGLLVPSLFAAAAEAAPLVARGRAIASVTTAIFLGQFLSPLLAVPLASRWGLGATFGLAGAVGLLVAGLLAAPAGVARLRRV